MLRRYHVEVGPGRQVIECPLEQRMVVDYPLVALRPEERAELDLALALAVQAERAVYPVILDRYHLGAELPGALQRLFRLLARRGEGKQRDLVPPPQFTEQAVNAA